MLPPLDSPLTEMPMPPPPPPVLVPVAAGESSSAFARALKLHVTRRSRSACILISDSRSGCSAVSAIWMSICATQLPSVRNEPTGRFKPLSSDGLGSETTGPPSPSCTSIYQIYEHLHENLHETLLENTPRFTRWVCDDHAATDIQGPVAGVARGVRF